MGVLYSCMTTECERRHVSVGDNVAVIEGDDIVVEGVVDSVEESSGVTVKIKENHSSIVEFWSNGISTSLSRWPGSNVTGKRINVSNNAKIIKK